MGDVEGGGEEEKKKRRRSFGKKRISGFLSDPAAMAPAAIVLLLYCAERHLLHAWCPRPRTYC